MLAYLYEIQLTMPHVKNIFFPLDGFPEKSPAAQAGAHGVKTVEALNGLAGLLKACGEPMEAGQVASTGDMIAGTSAPVGGTDDGTGQGDTMKTKTSKSA